MGLADGPSGWRGHRQLTQAMSPKEACKTQKAHLTSPEVLVSGIHHIWYPPDHLGHMALGSKISVPGGSQITWDLGCQLQQHDVRPLSTTGWDGVWPVATRL